jgi:hypothetical protein
MIELKRSNLCSKEERLGQSSNAEGLRANMAEARFCVNHPQTETYLRCNKCGKPVCIRCVERTPVGYRCKECLGIQRQGYYNATTVDYVLASIVAIVLSAVCGFVMSFIGRFGLLALLLAIFAGPIGGGVVAEGIRTAIQRHRGRYLWVVGCGAIVIGGVVGLFAPASVPLLVTVLTGNIRLLSQVGLGLLLNIGFWIYVTLAVTTAYARLRV